MTTNAQELSATRTHYSTDEGLTSNAISDMVQDKFGYIWLSTWNGLCRYDGYNFQQYTTGQLSGIPFLHNRIQDIYPDHEGNIWMRMYDYRIFVLNRKTDCIMSAFRDIPGGDNFQGIRKMTVSDDGKIYVTIQGKGIYELQMKDGEVRRRLFPTRHYHVKHIMADNNHAVWIDANEGLLRMDTRNGKIEVMPMLRGDLITALCRKKGKVYISRANGDIMQFDEKNPLDWKVVTTIHKTEQITSLQCDHTGRLWLTTNQPGVTYYDPKTGRVHDMVQEVPAPEADMHGTTIFDVGNHIWVRMNHGGFGFFDEKNDCIQYFHNNPNNSWNLSNTVMSYIALPEEVIFMSTNRRGLEKLELLNQRIDRKYPVPESNEFGINEVRAFYWDKKRKMLILGNKKGDVFGNGKKLFSTGGRIYHLTEDQKGNLWIADKDKGLFVYHWENQQLIRSSLIKDNAYQTLIGRDGTMWVAMYGKGIWGIRNGKIIEKINTNTNSYHKARTLCEAPNGDIWAGTTDGILIIRKNNGKYQATKIKQTDNIDYQLAVNDIIQIICDKKGSMWIATNGGGLAHTITNDSTGRSLVTKDEYAFESFGEKNGLPSDEIRSVTFDNNGHIWFAADQNICSYDPQKGFFTTFSNQDGIADVTCSESGALTLPNGKMLFGTLNGYYVVDTKKLGANRKDLFKLAITDFFVDGKVMSPRLNDNYDYYVPDSNYVEIPSRTCTFAFRFASLNYQLQHRVHFEYFMEGYDENWRNADRTRMAVYSDIPSGTYQFHVRAFVSESPKIYDEQIITVVVPHYYLLSLKAWWIYVIMIIIGLTIYLIWTKRKKMLVARMRVLKVGPQEIAFQEKDDFEFVKAQLDWLEKNYKDPKIKIEDMVKNSGLSRTGYYNQLKALTGLSPKEFVSDFRLKKACMYLKNNNCTVAEVAYHTGFNDPVYFTRLFRQKMGVTPTKYREDAQRLTISNENQK